jgi:hypothetical protein
MTAAILSGRGSEPIDAPEAMTTSGVVAVSRRIALPADDIFGVLVDPSRHVELDGSGMVRAAVSPRPVGAVGDVFVMAMHFPAFGDYEMENHVVAFESGRRIAWEPVAGRGHPEASTSEARWGHRWGYELEPEGPAATIVTETYDCSAAPPEARAAVDDGRAWLDSMAKTLERLEEVCTRVVAPAPAADEAT